LILFENCGREAEIRVLLEFDARYTPPARSVTLQLDGNRRPKIKPMISRNQPLNCPGFTAIVLALMFAVLTANSALGQVNRLPAIDAGGDFFTRSSIDPSAPPSAFNVARTNYASEPEYATPIDPGYSQEDFITPNLPPQSAWQPESISYQPWEFQILPASNIYKSYLASEKESRMAGHVLAVEDEFMTTSDRMWDSTLGARVGIFRYGTKGDYFPQGWQVDVEGSAQIRLDIDTEVDLVSADYRAGVPVTYGWGRSQFKLAYYHLSSHLGDEFQLRNPGITRLNFARDVIVLGYSFYPVDDLRLYGEVGWAFYNLESDPWEFQFGFDYAPLRPTGIHGAPFFAVNTHLRQEENYSGNVTVQTGWAWRGDHGRLLRVGVHYLNGKSNHLSFAPLEEEQIGFGLWYDF